MLSHHHTSYIKHFVPEVGLLSTFFCRQKGYSILVQYSQFDQREWFTVRMYSNHMFLLPPSTAAFSWLYLVLCHQTTFYDFLPPLNIYSIPALRRPYTNTYLFMYSIWLNICAFPYILGSPSSLWLCNRSQLNFLIYEEDFLFFFISVFCLHNPQKLMSLKALIIYTL